MSQQNPRPTGRSHRRRLGDRAQLRFGLVGAGSMGSNHARVIAKSTSATLVAVIDPDLPQAQRLADIYGGVASSGLETVRTCDAVVVAAPTARHVEIGKQLLADGMPVLMEKPLATSSQEVASLCDLAGARAVPLMCGFVERFNAVVRTLTQSLDAPVVHILSLRHSPGASAVSSSVVWDLLIHDIDLALRVSGDHEAETVWASTVVPEGAEFAELADCILHFPSGAMATLSASRLSQRKLRSMLVTTTDAVYDVDLLRQDVTVYRHVSAEYLMTGSPRFRSETVIDIPFVRHAGEPLGLQLEHFVDILEGRADQLAELRSIPPAHRLAERVVQAAASAAPAPGRTA